MQYLLSLQSLKFRRSPLAAVNPNALLTVVDYSRMILLESLDPPDEHFVCLANVRPTNPWKVTSGFRKLKKMKIKIMTL